MRWIAGILLAAAVAFAQPKRPVQEFETAAGTVRITPIQHASLLIEAGGQVIAIDPVSGGNYAGIPPADLILVTDVHGDHMDPKILPKISKLSTVILAPAAVAETIKDAKVIRNGETRHAGPFTIEAIPMYNLQRGPAPGKLFHDKGRGNGYVIAYAVRI
jgi:L-ascorbate metabolism protein UlaG (beta-lactamase superfamily)